jgi:hypothetical protein
LEPLNGLTIPFHGGGATMLLHATATDPVDGEIKSIQWSIDGAPPFSSTGITTISGLSLGAHTVSASATDSQNLRADAVATVTVSAQPPVPTILSPPDGASVGSGDLFVLRGYGFDYQDGALPDSSLIWTLDGQQIGIGSLLAAKILKIGTAPIVLTVSTALVNRQRSHTASKLRPRKTRPA